MYAARRNGVWRGTNVNPAPSPEDAQHMLLVSRLTSGQRACLLLVAEHFSSKEIAQRLGISSHTVDQRIRAALRTLKVSNRKEASLLLMRCLPKPKRRTRLPWPTRYSENNDLSIGWRLTWIVAIAAGSAFVSGLVMAAAESLQELVRGTGD